MKTNALLALVIGSCAFAEACGGAAPAGPTAALGSIGSLTSSEQPHFNLNAILRGEGLGLVKLRQEKNPTQNILYMDVWVRDLLPNTSYDLQRAVAAPETTSAPARTG